jgi:cell division protein FtsB
MQRNPTSRRLAALCLTTVLLVSLTVGGAEVDDSLKVVTQTNREAAASQEKIDTLSRETRDLLEEYRKLQDGSDYEAAYTRELEELDRSQQERIVALQEEIAQAKVTRQRIVPLMRSMADALEKFVVLDLPFHHEDRIGAVLQLKEQLNQADLSASVKFRRLLEAYQVEQSYGASLEAWRDTLQYQGEELSVEFLRVGRLAMYFQSLDGVTSGYWDAGSDRWQPLEEKFNRPLLQAIKVARNLTAPRLLQLPMPGPGGES